MSQDKSPEKKPVSLNDVWGQFDDSARALIIELFARLGYQRVVARQGESMKEEENVSPRQRTKDNEGTH
jgi:hypothetical protein